MWMDAEIPFTGAYKVLKHRIANLALRKGRLSTLVTSLPQVHLSKISLISLALLTKTFLFSSHEAFTIVFNIKGRNQHE
jgi:hypothetical protein